jgi:glutamate 5-kinase
LVVTVAPIVIKLGTQVLMDPVTGELAEQRLAGFVADCALMHQAGQAVLLVSSGAVGLGRQRLGLKPPLPLEAKQACAAIGQSWLMETYRRQFAQHGIEVAQVLLTARRLLGSAAIPHPAKGTRDAIVLQGSAYYQ